MIPNWINRIYINVLLNNISIRDLGIIKQSYDDVPTMTFYMADWECDYEEGNRMYAHVQTYIDSIMDARRI